MAQIAQRKGFRGEIHARTIGPGAKENTHSGAGGSDQTETQCLAQS